MRKNNIHQYFLSVVSILCIILFVGCNNDIFVDKSELPEITYVQLDSDDDSVSLIIPVDGLQHVRIDNISSADTSLKYYDANGHEIPAYSPFSEIYEILFDNVLCSYALAFSGDYMYFRNYYNCTGKESHFVVRLEYEYGDKVIDFCMAAGKKLEVLMAQYDSDFERTSYVEEKHQTFTVVNDSPLAQRCECYPYKDAYATALIEPKEAWAKYIELEMPLPILLGDEWWLQDGDFYVTCNEPFNYPCAQNDKLVMIEVPAHSKVKITLTVTYGKVFATGVIEFVNPVENYLLPTDFTCTAIYPLSYDIQVENEE